MKFFLNFEFFHTGLKVVGSILLFIGSMRWLAGALKGDADEAIRNSSLYLTIGILLFVAYFFLKKYKK